MTLAMPESVYRAGYRALERGASPALLDWWARACCDDRGAIQYYEVFLPDDLAPQARLILGEGLWEQIASFTRWLRPWVGAALTNIVPAELP